MKYTTQQFMAMTIWGESRGENLYSQFLTGWTIHNRWWEKGWYGDTIKDVILKPKQFSCWNEGDPNRVKMLLEMDKCEDGGCSKEMDQAMYIADGILTGRVINTSQGVNHYHANTVKPFWAKGREPLIVEGNHLFYKL